MRRARPWDPQVTAPLARLATAQHGVVSRVQLSALGMSDEVVATLVARGHLVRLVRGVYAVGHAQLSARGRWMAAVLACRGGALLGHGAALALHDCMRIPSGPVDVVAPSSHRVAGVRCHVARRCSALGAESAGELVAVGGGSRSDGAGPRGRGRRLAGAGAAAGALVALVTLRRRRR